MDIQSCSPGPLAHPSRVLPFRLCMAGRLGNSGASSRGTAGGLVPGEVAGLLQRTQGSRPGPSVCAPHLFFDLGK